MEVRINERQEYDSSVSYLHNTRPFLSVSEMKQALPNSLDLWEADTVHAWMSLHPWTDKLLPNLPFRPMIRSLFEPSETNAMKATDYQHQLIVVNTLTRMLWSVKEFEASPVNDLVRGTQSLKGSKMNIQEVLDQFLALRAPAQNDSSKTAISSVVRKSQIIHMSHLYGAGDLMDWIRPLLRGGSDAEAARRRAEDWGRQDLVRLRSVAYHSAQVLSLLRRYIQNEPLEAFNVFHAGIVLWCVAGLLSYDRRTTVLNGSQLRDSAYRLDATSSSRQGMSHADRDWIQNGRASVVFLHGVPDLCCARGQVQVLEQTVEILGNMHVWGIAQNFLLVISQILQREGGTV